MIYDGHAYCLTDIAGAGGFEDPADFRRHLLPPGIAPSCGRSYLAHCAIRGDGKLEVGCPEVGGMCQEYSGRSMDKRRPRKAGLSRANPYRALRTLGSAVVPIRYSSMPLAASRPSAMAHTTSD